MPKTLVDAATRAEVVARLVTLTPESHGRWGEMTVGRMVCHLADVYEAQYAAPTKLLPGKPLIRSFPVKHLALYVLPFPRGGG